jgi:hypothetical protein
MAGSLAAMEGHCGAIAFSRTGDPALGDYEDAVILKTVGEVDSGLLSGWRTLGDREENRPPHGYEEPRAANRDP